MTPKRGAPLTCTSNLRSGFHTAAIPVALIILVAQHAQGLQRWLLQACGAAICVVAVARVVRWITRRRKACRTSYYSTGTSEILLIGVSQGAIAPEVPPDVQFEPHIYEGVPSHTVSWGARSALWVLTFAWSVGLVSFMVWRFGRTGSPALTVDGIAEYSLGLGSGVLTISVLVDCAFCTHYIVLPSMLKIETVLRGSRGGTETACVPLESVHIELDTARGRLCVVPLAAGDDRTRYLLPLPRNSEVLQFSQSMIVAVLATKGRSERIL